MTILKQLFKFILGTSLALIAIVLVLAVGLVVLSMAVEGYHDYRCNQMIERSANTDIDDKIEGWVEQHIFSGALKQEQITDNGWPITWLGGARYYSAPFIWSEFSDWELIDPLISLFGQFVPDQDALKPDQVELVGIALNYRRGYLVKRDDVDFPKEFWEDDLTPVSKNVAVYCGRPRD